MHSDGSAKRHTHISIYTNLHQNKLTRSNVNRKVTLTKKQTHANTHTSTSTHTISKTHLWRHTNTYNEINRQIVKTRYTKQNKTTVPLQTQRTTQGHIREPTLNHATKRTHKRTYTHKLIQALTKNQTHTHTHKPQTSTHTHKHTHNHEQKQTDKNKYTHKKACTPRQKTGNTQNHTGKHISAHEDTHHIPKTIQTHTDTHTNTKKTIRHNFKQI